MALRANMLLASVAIVACLALGPQEVAAGHGQRTELPPPPSGPGPRDAAEAASRCCGPPSALPPRPPLGHPGPERCCGQGWGLHCCIGAACCLADAVVPNVLPRAPRPPPGPGSPRGRALLGSNLWWKDWAQWLNLGIVLAVVALVGGVLTCCWHRGRQDKAFRVRQQRLLGDSGLYSYGATGPNPSAPHWKAPMTSRWVDFSYKPPLNSPANSPYRPMVRPQLSESDTDTRTHVSPVFSSSDEEYKIVMDFKRKSKWPD